MFHKATKVFRATADVQGLSTEEIEKLSAPSFVAGNLTTVQFMVKDSNKFASTGGWAFVEFVNGEPSAKALHKTCILWHFSVAT